LVLLGVGADGHVASLFPNSYLLDERGSLASWSWVEKVGSNRITLMFPVINAARCVMMLVTGRDKVDAVRAALSTEPVKSRSPARRVDPKNGTLIWFLDREAAGTKV